MRQQSFGVWWGLERVLLYSIRIDNGEMLPEPLAVFADHLRHALGFGFAAQARQAY